LVRIGTIKAIMRDFQYLSSTLPFILVRIVGFLHTNRYNIK